MCTLHRSDGGAVPISFQRRDPCGASSFVLQMAWFCFCIQRMVHAFSVSTVFKVQRQWRVVPLSSLDSQVVFFPNWCDSALQLTNGWVQERVALCRRSPTRPHVRRLWLSESLRLCGPWRLHAWGLFGSSHVKVVIFQELPLSFSTAC